MASMNKREQRIAEKEVNVIGNSIVWCKKNAAAADLKELCETCEADPEFLFAITSIARRRKLCHWVRATINTTQPDTSTASTKATVKETEHGLFVLVAVLLTWFST